MSSILTNHGDSQDSPQVKWLEAHSGFLPQYHASEHIRKNTEQKAEKKLCMWYFLLFQSTFISVSSASLIKESIIVILVLLNAKGSEHSCKVTQLVNA